MFKVSIRFHWRCFPEGTLQLKPLFLHFEGSKDKLKCTAVQALRLCTGRKAHWGSRGIALPFYYHGTRRE